MSLAEKDDDDGDAVGQESLEVQPIVVQSFQFCQQIPRLKKTLMMKKMKQMKQKEWERDSRV